MEPREEVTAAELFERLEQRTSQLNNSEFAADFNTLRKVAEAANDASAVRLTLEWATQLVWLSGHGIKHFHAWEDETAAAHYLEARLGETSNEMLRLRYGLVRLTTLPRGRHTGRLAAEIMAQMRDWLTRDQGQHEATQNTYFELVQLGLLLSREYHCEPERMRQFVLEHLLAGQQSVLLRWWQVQFFGKHPAMFNQQECAQLDAVCQQLYAHYKADDRHMIKLVCEAAIPLARRATNNAQNWYRLKGDYIKAHAEQRYAADPADFVVQVLLKNALDCYQAANDRPHIQAVESLISATKHDVRLNKMEFDFTLDGPEGKFLSTWMRRLPTWILAENHLVFWRLRYNLIPGRPRPDVADSELTIVDVFRQTAFDRNRNITTRQQGGGRKLPFSPYSLLLSFYQRMTFETFAQGLQSEQLTYATMMEFLREQTWLGQMEYHRAHDDDGPSYTLISWVEPALRHYFTEMERAQQEPNYKPDLMLCIDSLTLKIEAILRHFCRSLDLPIATNRRGRDGDQQEKTLEEIIQSVEDYSGPDAGYWLRFIFTKEGWNVRNNVAHGFMNPADYGPGVMQTVIIGLFVLATLDIKPPKSTA